MNIDTTMILTVLINFAATVVTVVASNSKTKALITYRIEQLEKKVDKHNSVIERTYDLEKISEKREEQIKVANHRIEDLEEELKELKS